ncbi:ferric reductase-like transmembrane domain-containing protein [Candidatus Micrarchaeota archaeon]|nr:ferric reductase-like transmembrane domain-containing protein [Candidatus Micrarchaeota archaeon]
MPQTQYVEKTKWWGALGIAIATFLALYLYFDAGLDPKLLNKVYALHAATLLTLTFLIGSLSRFWPKIFNRYKSYRKALGLYGFLMAAGHVYTVLVPLGKSPSGYQALAGWAAFAVFLVMAITSNAKTAKRLGYGLWKRIQLVGYAALLLVGVHFFLVETRTGVLNLNSMQIVVLALVLLAVVLRIAAFIAGPRQKFTSYYDHFNGEDGEAPNVKPTAGKTAKKKTRKKKP